jgi:protein-tyrosine phosphatase
MARAAAADGVTTVAATPHVRADYPTTFEAIRDGVASLRARLASEGVDLAVLTGAEVSVEIASAATTDDLAPLGLGGNPAYLLVEMPYVGWPLTLPELVGRLVSEGIRPVIAHPERNPRVGERPEELRPLVDSGALVQVVAGSLTGDFGPGVARTAGRLLELELAHLLASDEHRPGGRGSLARAVELLDARLGAWLAHDVPRAIVAGAELPARPAGGRARRRRWLRPLRRRT